MSTKSPRVPLNYKTHSRFRNQSHLSKFLTSLETVSSSLLLRSCSRRPIDSWGRYRAGFFLKYLLSATSTLSYVLSRTVSNLSCVGARVEGRESSHLTDAMGAQFGFSGPGRCVKLTLFSYRLFCCSLETLELFHLLIGIYLWGLLMRTLLGLGDVLPSSSSFTLSAASRRSRVLPVFPC